MNHGRQVGVRIPQNQSTEQAPIMTVTRVAAGQPILVEYGDERGIKRTTIAFVFGDKAYIPPQSEAWTEGHRPFAQSINEQIIAKLQETLGRSVGTSPVPAADAVDVTGGLSNDQLEQVENSPRKS